MKFIKDQTVEIIGIWVERMQYLLRDRIPTFKVVVHIHNGILLDYKKEWYLTICDSMDGPGWYGIMLSEISQTQKDK